MVKGLVWLVVLGSVVGGGVVSYFKLHPEEKDDIFIVKYGDVRKLARGSGRIEGIGEMRLSFAMPGRVDAVNVEENQEVNPQAVLATLNPTEADIRIAIAEAAAKQAEEKLNLISIPRSPEAIKQAEGKLAEAREDVKGAEIKLKALVEPALPAPPTAEQLAKAIEAIEKAREQVKVAEAEQKQMLSGASQADIDVATHKVTVKLEQYDNAKKALAEKLKTNEFPPLPIIGPSPGTRRTRAELEAEVNVALRELQLAESERDRIKQGPTETDKANAQSKVNIAKIELKAADDAKGRLEKPEAPRPALDSDIAQARSIVESAKARMEQAGAALQLLKRGPEPAEVNGAKAAKDQADNELRLAKIHKEGLKLHAPEYGGLVLKRMIEPGSMVDKGMPVMTLVDFSRKRVRAEFDLGKLAEIKNAAEKGMPVSISSKAFRGETLEGKIAKIGSVGPRKLTTEDPSAPKGGEIVEVFINVLEPKNENKDKKNAFALIVPGLPVDAVITLEQREHVLIVPKTFVSHENKKDDEQSYVLRGEHAKGSEKPDSPRAAAVTCGLRDEEYVQITSGLQENDVIMKPRPQ